MKHLEQWTNKSSDKGFGQHVLKKFHFDVQQQLQLMMKVSHPSVDMTKFNTAFQAAMRLDQVEKFNQVVMSFVSCGDDVAKLGLFLTACIEYDQAASSYSGSRQARTDEMSSIDAAKTYPVEALSKRLSETADKTISVLNSKKARVIIRELRAAADSSVQVGADNGRNDGPVT